MYAPIGRNAGVSSAETTMLVGDVTLENVTKVNERGGQHAPTKKTEKGFSYGTSVGPEPVSATVEAIVEPATYARLADIRDGTQPFPVTVGFVSLGACKLDDLQIDQQSSTTSHYSVRISVTQIREAQTRTSTLVVDSADGSAFSGDSADTDVTLAQTKQKPVGDDSWSLGDTVNDIADAIGFP